MVEEEGEVVDIVGECRGVVDSSVYYEGLYVRYEMNIRNIHLSFVGLFGAYLVLLILSIFFTVKVLRNRRCPTNWKGLLNTVSFKLLFYIGTSFFNMYFCLNLGLMVDFLDLLV
jgi:hypothetical protein